MIALLASKTLQMVNITPGPHHHLECRYHFVAGRTQPSVPKQPQIITFAQHQIRFDVQRRADLAQSTIAAATLQTVLVPVHVQGAQQKAIVNRFTAFGTRLMGQRAVVGRRQNGFGFRAVHRHIVRFDVDCRGGGG